jgi:hypothetical protein
VAIGRVGGLAFPFLRLLLRNATIYALDTDCMISGIQFMAELRLYWRFLIVFAAILFVNLWLFCATMPSAY